MISLLIEPELESKLSDWTLVLYVCVPFDEAYSFRELFAKITAVLARTGEVALSLPPEEPGEDFVEGSLCWGSSAFDVYFERSLGYVEFSDASQASTRELLSALIQEFTWTQEPEGNSG